MNKKEEFFLTREGKNYPIDKDDKILETWTPKYRDHYDVLKVKIYKKDFHLSAYNPMPRKRLVNMTNDDLLAPIKRGKIKKFSFGSQKRLKFILRNTINSMSYEAGLTYPNEFPTDGLIIKSHFHKLRMRLNYYGYRNIWILEFQGRGAPHFHMLLDKEIKEEVLAKMWFDIVKSGDIKHLKRGVHVEPIRNIDAMSKYFSTYLSKQDQKLVPLEFQNVGRFWGYTHSLLECTEKKFYGNPSDIELLKKQLRTMRRWFDSKKRSWGKNKTKTGKVFKNKFIKRGTSFKVVNSDLFINELKRRGEDTTFFD